MLIKPTQSKRFNEMLLPIFKRYPVYRAILFGSYARGEETPNSDVDLIIDSRGELININFYALLDEVVEALQTDVDMFEISEIPKNPEFIESVRREGIILYERKRSRASILKK